MERRKRIRAKVDENIERLCADLEEKAEAHRLAKIAFSEAVDLIGNNAAKEHGYVVGDYIQQLEWDDRIKTILAARFKGNFYTGDEEKYIFVSVIGSRCNRQFQPDARASRNDSMILQHRKGSL